MSEKKPVFHMGMITRGKGQLTSAVDAGAYVFGEKWESKYDGLTYDHSDKAGEITYTATLAPEDAPAWVHEPYTFVHAVEWSERAKNAQLFRHLYFSLPPEFSKEQQIACLEAYVQETFIAKGMIALIAIHTTDGNTHGHVLTTTRLLLPDGTWAPKAQHTPVLKDGQRVKGKDGKCKRKKTHVTDWNRQDNGEKWRRMYATCINTHYQLAGLDTRIDHRSPKRQGLSQLSPVYRNPAEYLAECAGEETEVGNLNKWIKEENERRAQYEQRKAAIDQLLENYQQKMKGFKKREQWRSPQTRATQQFWSDLHAVEDQCKTGTLPATPPSSPAGHHSQVARRERTPDMDLG